MKCNYHPKPLTKEEQFEELKQIAEEEFGCTIINSSESKTFEEIFGFGMSNINENSEEEIFIGGFEYDK